MNTTENIPVRFDYCLMVFPSFGSTTEMVGVLKEVMYVKMPKGRDEFVLDVTEEHKLLYPKEYDTFKKTNPNVFRRLDLINPFVMPELRNFILMECDTLEDILKLPDRPDEFLSTLEDPTVVKNFIVNLKMIKNVIRTAIENWKIQHEGKEEQHTVKEIKPSKINARV